MTPEEAAAHEAQVDQQLRDLAKQIAQQAKLGFDPTTIRKGIVAGVSEDSPPTVAINLSGDTGTLISQVATLNNYTPLVGQTVLVAKQGTEIFLLGSIASASPRAATGIGGGASTTGWVKATLTNGTHGGNDNDVYYRRIMDNGSWKMQWRGVWNPGGQSFMINTADALDTDYRPTSYRALAAARDVTSSTDRLATVRMDFAADGTIRYYSAAPALDINPSSPGTSSNGSHAHGYFDDWDGLGSGSNDVTSSDGSHSHTVNSHFHGGTISVAAPSWISLNGLEYFL